MGDPLLRKLLITSEPSPNLARQSDNRVMELVLQVLQALGVLAVLGETSAPQELLF
jgi:ABC-type ATPase involved in cell division